jgi:hypothetical protein
VTANNPTDCWASCASCGRRTHHAILCQESRGPAGPDDYPTYYYYQIVKCHGCHSLSFRHVEEDYVGSYVDDNGKTIPSVTVERYPRILEDHRGFRRLNVVPQTVRAIYQETVNATKEGALTLAGIGFRAVIEAICNERGIKGRDLQKRIEGLAKAGMISAIEAVRLHAIRFLGNDAAHDIKSPSLGSIQVVLRIVEHLIENIYVLDSEAEGTLETVISTYDDFKTILQTKLKEFPSGTEQPLASFLGKTIRRLVDSFPAMEKQLVAEVTAGTFVDLKLGKLAPMGGSPTLIQCYIRP